MRTRFILASLGALLILVACFAPSVMVKKEGDRTIIVMSGAEFVLPPGFQVIDTVEPTPGETFDDTMVVMAKSGQKFYTAIIFSRQRAKGDDIFKTVNLKTTFPDALSYHEDLEFIDHAAAYAARMPMARRLYFEEPLCKVVTAYRYPASGKTRFRLDIYQNFAKEDPFRGCCGKRKEKRKPQEVLEAAKKAEVEKFRNFAFTLMKDNVRWP